MSHSLFAAIAGQAKITPNVDAIAAYGRPPLSYAALCAHLQVMANTFNAGGIGRGDRVAIVLPGGAEMATACLSVMACATALPINPDYKQPEYEAILAYHQPKCLLMMAGGQHPARSAAKALAVPVVDLAWTKDDEAGAFKLVGELGKASPSLSGLAHPDDIALVLQTSGTTSKPKVVPLSQGNLLASAKNLLDSLQLTAEDRCLHFLPMFHIGGIVDVLIAPLLAGGTVICETSFSSPAFFRDLAHFKPTWTQAVPVMLQEMQAHADANPESVLNHSLRLVRSVSAPLPEPLMMAFERTFGIPVIEIFGMTETAGVITSNPLPPAERISGAVGIAVGTQVKVLDTNGEALSAQQTGEIVVRGENVMAGYEDDAADNAQAFVDGWFRTGDLGRLDENGYLYLSGRVKDMINRGGEKITPQEVDQVLLAHPAVADAASFAIPHASLGEDIGVVLVLKNDAAASNEELLSYLRARLAFFKIPRMLHRVDEIPRGANGKLQRAVLTERFASFFSEKSGVGQQEFVAPQTPVAKLLAEMWSKFLNEEKIGIHDDFFYCGGDSLTAASFINELQQRWGDTIYVSSLFDAPTIAQYEVFLRQHYPEVVARMLGESVAPKQTNDLKVTPEMVVRLRDSIARPKALPAKPLHKNPQAIFVLSPPRSGSTLVRAIMAGHPKLFAPPELYLLTYNNLADRKAWYSGSQRFQLEGNVRALMQLRDQPLEAIQAFMADLETQQCPTQDYYRMMQEWLGDRILVDKTPAYAIHRETLERAELYFENAIYVHLLRHPYGMIRSFEEAKLEQLWYPRLVGADSAHLDACPYSRRQLAEMIWLVLHENILAFLQTVPAERQFQLKFEDLVNNPEQALNGFCNGVGIDFVPEMLKPQDDPKRRMTDGIHAVSRMIGDPKFHQHKQIEAQVADQWKDAYEMDFLSEETQRLAVALGYFETIAEAKGRQDFEL